MKKRLRLTVKPPMSKRATEDQPIIETDLVKSEADKLMWDSVCRVFLRNDLGDLRPELRSEAYDEAHLWYASHPTATACELQTETRRIADRIRYPYRPDRQRTVALEHKTDEDGTSVQVNDNVSLKSPGITFGDDDQTSHGNRRSDSVKVNRAPGSEVSRVLNLDLPQLKQWGEELFENLYHVYYFIVGRVLTDEEQGFYWGYEWKALPRTNANRKPYSRLKKKVDSRLQEESPVPFQIMVAMFRADTYRHGITSYFKMPAGTPIDLQALTDAEPTD